MIVRMKTLIKGPSIKFTRGDVHVRARTAVVVIVSRPVKVMKRCIAIGVKYPDANIAKSQNTSVMKNQNTNVMRSHNANAMRNPNTKLTLAMRKSINNHTKRSLNF